MNVERFRPTSGAFGKDGTLGHDHYGGWLTNGSIFIRLAENAVTRRFAVTHPGEPARVEATKAEMRPAQALP